MAKIPTVDLADNRAKVTETIGRALEEIGFVFIRTTGIESVTKMAYSQFRILFSLPEGIKERYAHPELYYQRGWTPSFKELGLACKLMGPQREPRPDAKECWGMGPARIPPGDLGRDFSDFYPSNIWPDEEVPGFRIVMEKLYRRLNEVGTDTFNLLEGYLDFPRGYFRNLTNDAPHFMRAIHYPPITAEQAPNIQWGCKHTDINFLTVLPASTLSGLWVRCHDGNWVSGRPDENCVIVQVGDMLQHHTGGRFRSAVHEVRAPKEGTAEGRLSAALFIHARPDTVLNPEPKDGRFPSITAGNYLRKRLAAIGLASTRY